MIIMIIVLIVFIGIDLGSKYAIMATMELGERVEIIPNILTFIYTTNEGASFGMFSGEAWLLLGVSTIVTLGMIAFLILNKFDSKFFNYSLTLIVAGGAGNLYDRFVYGYVRDFIDYTFLETWFNINFAICNMADVFLSVGCVLLCVFVLFVYKEKPKEEDSKKEDSKEEST